MTRSLMLDFSPLRDSVVFRNLFVARTILLFGVGMVSVTVPLDVFARTGSTVQVSFVAALEAFAFFAGFMSGGVLADRGDRWTIILNSWLVCGLSFLGLAANALFLGALWPVFVLVAVNGLSGSLGITAMFAVIPGLVDRSKLHAVGALNTMSLRLGTVLAPVSGGAVVAAVGAQWNYSAGAIAALGTWVLLLVSPSPKSVGANAAAVDPAESVEQVPGAEPDDRAEGPLRSLRTGYRFIVGEPVVLGVMLAGVVGMIGGGSLVLIPALVAAEFGGDPTVVGLMYSALSLGLILGAVGSGRVHRAGRPGLVLLLMMIVSFLCFAGAGASPSVLLALAFLVGAGMSNSVEEVLRYALLQLRTPDPLLGRVNSAFAAQNMSGAALGALVAGAFGASFGAAQAFWLYNLTMAVVGIVVLALLGSLRRVPVIAGEAEFA